MIMNVEMNMNNVVVPLGQVLNVVKKENVFT